MPAPASPISPPPSEALDLSVIIVNYNVREFLEQALRSVFRARGHLRMEVFVVDNNSVDGSVEMVRSLFPEVTLIVNQENVGFGRANNQAIRRARGRYLLILNPDTLVQEDTLTTLVRFMDEHPEAGAVGCRILNPDGTFAPESRRAFPTPAVAFYRMTGLSRLFPRSRRFGRYNLTYLPEDRVAEVDALSGSCMMVRHAALYYDRTAWEARPDVRPPSCTTGAVSDPHPGGAGLFDEDFFMYGEDLDWCFRIQRAGWKIYYTPATQIIHYKGESTKKGELRYVRHFYGAMILFTRKHFQDRYSRLFAALLQAGIMARATLTVLAGGLRRLRAPLVDLLLVFAVVSIVGALRAQLAGGHPAPLFFATVAAGYALGTVAGIALSGGYRWHRQRRLRPVLTGATLGLLLVGTASFFFKEIAFSRMVVLVSFPLAIGVLAVRRLLRPRKTAGRTAVFVGPAAEAERLWRALAGHPDPPFTLAGYVASEPVDTPAGPLPRLGAPHHLRDLVRLRRFDEVVFSSDGLPLRTTFTLMQQLRDLPVQFRMLAQDRPHLIGKAAIDDLTVPLVEAEAVLPPPRTRLARRAFEVPVALGLLLAHPFLALAARWRGPGSGAARLAARTRLMPDVLRGHRALVGYRPETGHPPPEAWDLPPAVFDITETLRTNRPSPEERNRAYWFYLSRQSASLDWDVLVRSIKNLYFSRP